MKGTIFVNPDFVDKSKGYRTTIEEVKTLKQKKELFSTGFCNWDELKKMDSEKVMEVQSHALTHTWYPISDKIIDYRHPGDDYIWMDWNTYPEEKSQLQLINSAKSKLGMAIFEHEKSMSSKRVFINEDFQQELHYYVKKHGNESFFDRSDWKENLDAYVMELKKKYQVITKEETSQEYFERIKY